ncbi:abortive infection protein [Brachybacterium phenoliresistens]|uniref:Abortive infection protein n=1 Tax=Brachybacterium phenoliresistens TaxID=396014 RepID=Z9JT12_9MICO|nr:type II CAAX endopeptidase family protein [Brachybacterium phenoliresistens]EWS81339.1 abortive infection protein [Brachybacterium phenoliresistens]
MIVVWLLVSSAAAVGMLSLQEPLGVPSGVLSLVMLAPAIGAGATWLLVPRARHAGLPAASTARFLFSLMLASIAVGVFVLGVRLARGESPAVPEALVDTPLALILVAQLLGAVCEEVGFRGVLLHQLLRRVSRPIAAVVDGALFALWHVQYFSLPPLQHAAFVLAAIALTVTMVFVMTGSFWQRIAICSVIHLGANLALAFTGEDVVDMTVFAAISLVAAGILVPAAILRDRRSIPAEGPGHRRDVLDREGEDPPSAIH